NLPKGATVSPIASASDGTQIWKITHNGVDTHPIHFHLYDVQLLNRVTWDNIVIPPDPNELGWKDTVRISPLEDTIVALRPVIPTLPFDVPNSIRLLSPMAPEGAILASSTLADQLALGMNAFNPAAEPVDIVNHYVNFGWEYVYHCHILSHEEMDMMRPVLIALPPVSPSNLAVDVVGSGDGRVVDLTWRDNSRSETAFVVQRTGGVAGAWTVLATLPSTTGPEIGGTLSYSDPVGADESAYSYRVQAINVVGDTWDYADPEINEIVRGGFPTVTASSGFSNEAAMPPPPFAPSDLVATASGSGVSLTWTDNSSDETGFTLRRSVNGGPFEMLLTLGADVVSYTDAPLATGSYQYRISAVNTAGASSEAASNVVDVLAPPLAPTNLVATVQDGPQVLLTWTDNSTDETQFAVYRSVNGAGFEVLAAVAADSVTYTDTTVASGSSYQYQVTAVNAAGPSASAVSNTVSVVATLPAPTDLVATSPVASQVLLTWMDNSADETGFVIQRSFNGGAYSTIVTTSANATTYTDTGLVSATYQYRVAAVNAAGSSAYATSAQVSVTGPPAAPTNLTAAIMAPTSVKLSWIDQSNNESSFAVWRSVNGAPAAQIAVVFRNSTQRTETGGTVSYTNTGLTSTNAYSYYVTALATTESAPSNTVSPAFTRPAAPSAVTVTAETSQPSSDLATLTWTDNADNEASYKVQAATNETFTQNLRTITIGANGTSASGPVPRNATLYFRVQAANGMGASPWVNATPFPIVTP
ncbi:MAG: multicopper oxidase domain-containing protein, partial [Deltaproteobacteria bacterium]|nr:multicopper oxidase domain-containing protein [Deltaproteobacteria bacterium]